MPSYINLEKYVEKRTVRSFGHATSNEDGKEEFSIEFDKTLWQMIFNRPATSFVFVRPKLFKDMSNLTHYEWTEKHTGRSVTSQWTINQFVLRVRGS